MKSKNILSSFFTLSLILTSIVGCGCNNNKKVKKGESTPANHITIDNGLRKRLVDFSTRPRTKGQFAFYVYDLTADKPVYGLNEKKAIPVASCLKLLSGVAGLHLLGTKYLYPTSIYTRGKQENGTLHGDIIFKGDLDPLLNEPDLAMFAKALKKDGI